MDVLVLSKHSLHLESDNWIKRPQRLLGAGMREMKTLYVDFSNIITSYRDGKELNKLMPPTSTACDLPQTCNSQRPERRYSLKALAGPWPQPTGFSSCPISRQLASPVTSCWATWKISQELVQTCSWPNSLDIFLNLGMEKECQTQELDNLFINLIFPAVLLCFQNDCPFCDF